MSEIGQIVYYGFGQIIKALFVIWLYTIVVTAVWIAFWFNGE